MATNLATWFATEFPWIIIKKNEIAVYCVSSSVVMTEYLLACFLQDLETVIEDFRDVVLLNFTAVLRYRMVHDRQLLKDTQVQLCSLDIAQLSQNKHQKAFNLAAVITAVSVVVLYLLQFPKKSSHYEVLNLINSFKNKLLYDWHHFISCEVQNKSQTA